MYTKRNITRAQFLDRLGLNKATRTRIQYILDELEKTGEVTYVSRGGCQYVQVIAKVNDDLSIINGGHWRVWLDKNEDQEGIMLFLLAELQNYGHSDEELPF